jgi:hypothetical protein
MKNNSLEALTDMCCLPLGLIEVNCNKKILGPIKHNTPMTNDECVLENEVVATFERHVSSCLESWLDHVVQRWSLLLLPILFVNITSVEVKNGELLRFYILSSFPWDVIPTRLTCGTTSNFTSISGIHHDSV